MSEEQNERIEALEGVIDELRGTVRSAVRTAEVAIDQVLDINEKLEARLGCKRRPETTVGQAR